MREARYTKAEGGPEQLDEVVADDVASFQLEQMHDGGWWIGLDHHDGTTTHINIYSRSGRASVDARCDFDC